MARGQLYRTGIFCGEGDRDWSWLKYLYSLYHIREVRIHPDNAHGGSPTKQIYGMLNGTKEYDFKVALFDTDKGENEVNEALALAGDAIKCILSEKNIECEILRLCGVNRKRMSRAMESSHGAKKEFQAEFHLKQEDDEVDWKRFFPKGTLDKLRKTSEWLDEIIKVIEGE